MRVHIAPLLLFHVVLREADAHVWDEAQLVWGHDSKNALLHEGGLGPTAEAGLVLRDVEL